MRKTEESLRRLKKGKMSAFSLFSGSPTANRDQESKDEERVRVQMVLDVAALGNDARSLHVDVDNHATFHELETMAAHGTAEGMLIATALCQPLIFLKVHENYLGPPNFFIMTAFQQYSFRVILGQYC